MTEITRVTEKYLAQLSDMADNLNRFGSATASLTEVSNVLLDSYKSITDNSSDISSNSRGYVEQMGTLNKNLSGLNTIYEIQLKSISSQIDTIDRVNNGLLHIRNMYEGSMEDSVRFKKETEAMAENLANLNRVYTRMLEAMTPGNGMNGGFPTGR
jgi:gliding motility-associated protein GldL